MTTRAQADRAGLTEELAAITHPQKAAMMQRYFKTGKGDYGEGDIFLGVTVREERAIAKKYGNVPLALLEELLRSPIHEERAVALIILEN